MHTREGLGFGALCIYTCYVCIHMYTAHLYMYKSISIFKTFILKDGMYIYTRTCISMIVSCFLVCFLWVLRSESLEFTS
jgi:hypothetical protein